MPPYAVDYQEKIYQLALSLIKGVGFVVWQKLIDQYRSAKDIYNNSNSVFANIYNHKYHSIIKAIHGKNTLSHAETIINAQQKMGIKIISFFDKEYPDRLRRIKNPPCFLYCKGNLDLSLPRIVSIVGTRRATTNGKMIVKKLVEELSEYGVMIVSGLAYGIDVCAHEIALQQQLPTVAVLANSLDKIYPSSHTKLACSMLSNGGLLSEVTTGNALEAFHFPNRNRIIAGLADATIVVEAGNKSGALTTAQFANNYDREVFAFPGNIYEPFAAGCNELIRNQQAHLVTCVDDIVYMMHWQKNTSDSTKKRNTYNLANKLADLNTEDKQLALILKACYPKVMHIDDLCQHTQLTPIQLSPKLLQLELNHLVENCTGNKYKFVEG